MSRSAKRGCRAEEVAGELERSALIDAVDLTGLRVDAAVELN